ncbi:hypothetical protein ACJ41O_003445 [Fusarium nematophilum]
MPPRRDYDQLWSVPLQEDIGLGFERRSLIKDENLASTLKIELAPAKKPPETDMEPPQTYEVRPFRKPTDLLTLWHLLLDVLFGIPALVFLVFAILVYRNEGKRWDEHPVTTLRAISNYGPTVFPIVFAAAAVNFLKAVAAWRLERGISVLSLEFLLSSRTVFSTLSSPMALNTVNILTPFLVALWALSPLGGQAALRVVMCAPSSEVNYWEGRYLEFRGELPFQEGGDGVPHSLPAVIAVFGAALSSPKEVKAAGQDTFGHVKIPLIEAFLASEAKLDDDGWYPIDEDTNTVYSSIAGLPIASNDTFRPSANYSFNLSTSYMLADCKLERLNLTNDQWRRFLNKDIWTDGKKPTEEEQNKYHNDLTMAIEVLQQYNDTKQIPMKLNFTSYTRNATTRATCELATSYVEVDVRCHRSECRAVGVRPWEHDYDTLSTVFNGLAPSGWMEFWDRQYQSVLGYFANSTNNMWDWVPTTDPYSSPIELYLTNPDIPYAVLPNGHGWRGEEIWPVGDKLFSQRFTQLLNSFWLAKIAPFAPMGRVNISTSDALSKELGTLKWQPVNGTKTPDDVVLKPSRPWLGMLIVSCLAVIAVSLAAAGLNLWRRGPDILDYATSMMRDSPFINDDMAQGANSMEDGMDRTTRLKNMKVCLGDVRPEEKEGYIAMATAGRATRLRKLPRSRMFR